MEFEIFSFLSEECGCLTSCVLSFANLLSGLTHFCKNTTSARFLREATNTQPYGVEIYIGCGQTTRTSGYDAAAGEKVRTKKKKKKIASNFLARRFVSEKIESENLSSVLEHTTNCRLCVIRKLFYMRIQVKK